MSYDRGLAALRLEMPDRIPHTEYVSHWELVRRLTGLDPADASQRDEAWRRFYVAAEYDFLVQQRRAHSWQDRGRTTDMGHAEWLEDGSDRRDIVPSPFRTVEEVLAFDAAEEYGLPDFEGWSLTTRISTGGPSNSTLSWSCRGLLQDDRIWVHPGFRLGDVCRPWGSTPRDSTGC